MNYIAPVPITHSSIAGNVPGPSEVAVGALAVNLADGKLYTKDYTEQVKEVGGVSAAKIASAVTAATSKATPVDADELPLVDSAASFALKKLTWSNIKATLLTWLQATVFPAPGAIGGTTAAAAAFTTLTTSSTVTHNAGTANGVAFLNASKQLSSGTDLVLDATGNLLIGTTSANKYGVNFKLRSVSSGNYAAQIEGAGSDAILWVHNTSTTAGTRGFIEFYVGAGTQVGSITTNGSATSYTTSSDYRLKNITGPVTNSGAYIDALNPVEGTWKADGSTFVGLLAHEVQAVSRTNVATGVKDGPKMQAMDYSSAEIIANLIAEVQSLRTRFATLEKSRQSHG
jgi:hypothetical protein